MNTYKWTVTELLTLPSPPAPVNEYVVLANYTVIGTDGEITVGIQGTSEFRVNHEDSGYTPYDDLTEEQVLGWIQSEQNLVSNVQSNLDGQIYAIENPPVEPQKTPLPW